MYEDGSPDTHGDVDLCVGIHGYGGMFNYHCGHLMNVLCETEAGITPPTTETPPTTPMEQKCHDSDDGWILMPGRLQI